MTGLVYFELFSSSRPRLPEITEKLWSFAQAAYLDNPSPLFLRNAFSSFFLAFVQSATVSLATPVSLWLGSGGLSRR